MCKTIWMGAGRTLLMLAMAFGVVGCGNDSESNVTNPDGGTSVVQPPDYYSLTININPIDTGFVTRNPDKSAYIAGRRTPRSSCRSSLSLPPLSQQGK